MATAPSAIVLLLLAHVAQAARLIHSSFHSYTNPWKSSRITQPKCKALEASGKLNWTQFAGKEWMEMMHYPKGTDACNSWIFFPANRTVVRRTRSDIYSKNFSDVSSKFEPDAIERGPANRGEQFQQILYTDNHSWALLHECQPIGFGSRFSILAPKATTSVSARMAEQADRYMEMSAHGKRARWVSTRCQPRRQGADASGVDASSLLLESLNLYAGCNTAAVATADDYVTLDDDVVKPSLLATDDVFKAIQGRKGCDCPRKQQR